MTGPDAGSQSAAGNLIFPFFSCTSLFSCWGAGAGASSSSTRPQSRQSQPQLLPLVSEDGVKCQWHLTAGRLRAPEDNLAKAGWLWVQGCPSPCHCAVNSDKLNPISNLLSLDQNHPQLLHLDVCPQMHLDLFFLMIFC